MDNIIYGRGILGMGGREGSKIVMGREKDPK